jgi:uncharacterized SAM-binding protein YcdF (DUF218 family)
MKIKLTVRKQCTRWTIWSWMIFIITVFLIFYTFVMNVVPFLSREYPQPAKIMVLEGYVPDHAYKTIISIFYRDNYDLIITTGTSYDQGFYISGIETAAELIALSLRKLGFDTTKVRMVPVPPDTHVNRTYNSALVTFDYIQKHHPGTNSINIVSQSIHARRSIYLFKKVYEPHIKVGNIVIPDNYISRNNWFRTSRGFRGVINETIAYMFVKLFFWPELPE